jgi:hypothetical protein
LELNIESLDLGRGARIVMKLFDIVDERTWMGRIFNREKYVERIPLEKLVASPTVGEEGTERYYEKFKLNDADFYPFLVVRKRDKDVYAVWDGLHKYWGAVKYASEARPGSGRTAKEWKMPCAVVDSNYDVLFYMVKDGHFQFGPHFTRYVRPVLKKLADRYLEGDLREKVMRFV